MKKITKIIITGLIGVMLFSQIAFAVDTNTVLPKSGDDIDCESYDRYITIKQAYLNLPASATDDEKAAHFNSRVEVANTYKTYTRDEQYEVLACAIKDGRFHLFMVPYMIRYFIEFVIQLSGLICVLYIVIGSYEYIIGSSYDNKQQGKDTIKNAIIGLIITLLSWIIVNIVQVALTGNNV